MIVFWTLNDQRKKRFVRVDTVYCHRGFRILESDEFVYVHASRCKKVKPAAIFDDSTTPWTLKFQASHHPFVYLADKHDGFPKTFITSQGHIVDIRFRIIMETNA